MEVNEEKRKKFMENAGKRVNKVMHDIQILEPMSRSSVYDFTKDDVDKMFFAMQDALNTAKAEYEKKFEEKSKTERRVFSFDNIEVQELSRVQNGGNQVQNIVENSVNQSQEIIENQDIVGNSGNIVIGDIVEEIL